MTSAVASISAVLVRARPDCAEEKDPTNSRFWGALTQIEKRSLSRGIGRKTKGGSAFWDWSSRGEDSPSVAARTSPPTVLG
jgi:hypothetical protein